MSKKEPRQPNDTDVLEQENENPDRPPVTDESPQHDPFDPFETAHLADGGAVINDATEIEFQTVLDTAKPATTQSPSIGESNIQQSTSHITLQQGTLLADIADLLQNTDRETTYILTEENGGITHHISLPTMELQLHITDDSVVVQKESFNSESVQNVTERNYDSFEKGFAACIEAIDWGALPPENSDPTIWEYNGFSLANEKFIEYISGQSNDECGNHCFKNTDADYKITINSYSCRQAHGTIAILELIDTVENRAIYRRRFKCQKNAFEFMFDGMKDKLSSAIELHEGEFGDETKIPSVNNLRL